MAIPLLWVVSIDDGVVVKPHTKDEFYALMGRLGDEGVAAILDDMNKHTVSGASVSEVDAKNA